MRKRILIGLVLSIAILGYFYPNRQDDEVRKSVEIQKIIKPDKNITVVTEQKINQPPTVDAGADGYIEYEYNGDGKITKVMRDYNRDGIANEIYL